MYRKERKQCHINADEANSLNIVKQILNAFRGVENEKAVDTPRRAHSRIHDDA